MELHKPPFLDQEATVADLAKRRFCDKVLIDKRLFEIRMGAKKGPKPPQKPPKSGEKKNFHFGDFGLQK